MTKRSIPKIAFSLKEAVISTGVGRSTILGAIERGELPVKRVGLAGPGRKIVILASSLEAWLTPDMTPPPSSSAPAEIAAHG